MGYSLRLIDGLRGVTRGYLEFEFDACTRRWGIADLAGAPSRPVCVRQGRRLVCSLTRWLDESDAFGRRVCRLLRAGVADALTTFTEAVAAAPGGRTRCVRRVYPEALTAVYRILFLLFAEARRLVPIWHPVYAAATA